MYKKVYPLSSATFTPKALRLSVAMSFLVLGFSGSAMAGSLQISPSLEGQSPPVIGSSPMPSDSQSGMSDLHGYAQWSAPQTTLEQTGYGVAHKRSSFGNAIPLKDALPLIMPHGWEVYAKTGVMGSTPVTWKAHHVEWTHTLKGVLRQAGLIATINWSHQALLLRVKPVPAVKPLDTKGYTSWGESSSLPANFHEGAAVPVSSPSLAGATPVFILNQGDLILLDLKKWAKESGWKVVWQVPEDWTVPNTTTFSGNFQTAVTQVVQALANNGANIHAVFHTENNTVVISGTGSGSAS